MRSDPGSIRPEMAAAEPVRRWQRVQWQYPADRSGRETSKRTAPHRHAPVSGSVDIGRLEDEVDDFADKRGLLGALDLDLDADPVEDALAAALGPEQPRLQAHPGPDGYRRS